MGSAQGECLWGLHRESLCRVCTGRVCVGSTHVECACGVH